jgi:hypothetical protein
VATGEKAPLGPQLGAAGTDGVDVPIGH